MTDRRSAIEYKEGQQLLFDSSYRGIPFNVIMATSLAVYLAYNQCPKNIIISWIVAMVFVSALRLFHCKYVLRKDPLVNGVTNVDLKVFLLLCFMTSLVWASIYFLMLPYAKDQHTNVIMLVFGGMAAGASTLLAVYFSSYLIYAYTMFLSVTIYNFSLLDVNLAILGVMYILYMLALTIIAKTNHKLLKRIFFLTEQNQILLDKFEMLSITDPLTGLYNRRHFAKSMQDEYNRAKRNGQSFALVSIDIDHFKLINDNFGHPFGDKFIIYTADYLKHSLRRANDIIFRLGGDEFAAILLNTTGEKTKQICEEIITKFKESPRFDYDLNNSQQQKILSQISMSIGVVYVPHESKSTIEQIIEKADQSLYQSKHEGKNQIHYTTTT